jgi:glucosyl-3-phosphoglycerate synthase
VTVRVVTPCRLTAKQLAELKGDRRLSVCLPALNEETTVGRIAGAIRGALMLPAAGLIDELIVMDDGSVDATARVAEAAGATVVKVSDVLPERPSGRGKGNVLWRSIAASTGDIVVWCDADLTSFTPAYVIRLVAPFLETPNDTHPPVQLVKGFYERPQDGSGGGGGRTTELVARPLLSMFFADLATVRQPLGGEYAITRSLAEQLPFVEGYGVEVGLLIDTLRLVGLDAIAQVDLGVRTHRHQPLSRLAAQAAEITALILQRAGIELPNPLPPLVGSSGIKRPIAVTEQPPLRDTGQTTEVR